MEELVVDVDRSIDVLEKALDELTVVDESAVVNDMLVVAVLELSLELDEEELDTEDATLDAPVETELDASDDVLE